MFAVNFALTQMSDKMRKRVFLHKRVEDVKKIVDKSLLPKEYGGKVPMSEMIESFKKELEEKRDLIMSNDQMSVKLELYPQPIRDGSVRSLKSTIEDISDNYVGKKEVYGLQGSFRKLEIDWLWNFLLLLLVFLKKMLLKLNKNYFETKF